MERNKFSKELIHSQLENNELCHMTPEEKKAYNAEYYKRNKEKFWGVTGNRPVGRQKYVTEGGSGVYRRGSGLGTGPVGNTSYPSSAGAPSRGIRVSDDPNTDPKDRKKLARNYQNKIAERNEYEKASQKLKKRFKEQINSAGRYKASGNDKEAARMMELAERSKQEYEWYDRVIEDYDKNRIPAAQEALARYDALSEMHSSGQMNPNKPSVQVKKTDLAKEKVKSKAKQAASDWKSGAKAVSQLASDGVSKGKSIASAILSKFRK